MRSGRHSTITAAQREDFWRRYKAGESVLGIIGALGQRRANVHRVLEASGGIAPVPRTRSQRVLRFGEREDISRGLAVGDSFRNIARQLNRAASTISQEVAWNGGRRGYRAAHADWKAWESARRPKRCVLSRNQQLQRIVAVKLQQDWSPQQIAGWLRDHYSGQPEMWVSHETIYRSLFCPGAGRLDKRAPRSPAHKAALSPISPRNLSRAGSRGDHRRGLHTRASGRGGRPCGPGSLGG